jgi:hypothetical protein
MAIRGFSLAAAFFGRSRKISVFINAHAVNMLCTAGNFSFAML